MGKVFAILENNARFSPDNGTVASICPPSDDGDQLWPPRPMTVCTKHKMQTDVAWITQLEIMAPHNNYDDLSDQIMKKWYMPFMKTDRYVHRGSGFSESRSELWEHWISVRGQKVKHLDKLLCAVVQHQIHFVGISQSL